MRLYGEIMEKTGLAELFKGARCSLLLGGGGYFQGVKAVLEFSEEKTALRFSNGEVVLNGKGFCILKYCDGDLSLSGEITDFSFRKNERNGGRKDV